MNKMSGVRRFKTLFRAAGQSSPWNFAAAKRFRASVFFLAALGLLLSRLSGISSSGSLPAAAAGGSRSFCWVLVDVESFFCAACLDPLLAFFSALPARVQEEQVRGILIYETPAGEEEAKLRSRIVLKKWEGFCKAHDIRFPAAADTGRFFRGFLKSGTVILLFDDGPRVLESYSLPLKSGQLDEIVRKLADRADRS